MLVPVESNSCLATPVNEVCACENKIPISGVGFLFCILKFISGILNPK